jgi:hypothetical protein
MIVEYKLHRSKQGNKIIPLFIEDGGYFAVGNKLVGHTVDNESYIPSTLVVLDKAALITRLTNSGYKVYDNDTERLATAEEIETTVDAFISKHD